MGGCRKNLRHPPFLVLLSALRERGEAYYIKETGK